MSREDLSDITGIRTTTIRLEISPDVFPRIDLPLTGVAIAGLARLQAALPVDVGGEIIRVHPDRPARAGRG